MALHCNINSTGIGAKKRISGEKKTKLASRGIVKQTFVPSSVTPGEMCLGHIWLDCMPCGREAAE